MPSVESVTTTKVVFSNNEWDDMTALRVQLNSIMQDGNLECDGAEFDLLLANLQACMDNLSS